jgi:hypothetical protein
MIKCYINALQEGCNVHSGHGTKVSVDVDGVAVPGDWPELLKCRIFSVQLMRRRGDDIITRSDVTLPRAHAGVGSQNQWQTKGHNHLRTCQDHRAQSLRC